MDHTSHQRVDRSELSSANLEGATIYGPDDEDIGTISHLHGNDEYAQVIVDVGGFLGIGAKPVAIRLSDLDIMTDSDGVLHATTMMDRDQVEALPEHHD